MRAVLILALAVSACTARPLTDSERAFTGTVMGPAISLDDVRIVKGAVVGLIPATVPPRPRTTCREKLLPPRTLPGKGYFPAYAFRQSVFYTRRAWSDDFLAAYPSALDLRQAMRLAHELTHVWQWQARARTGYHPFKASAEHIAKDDPYLLEIDAEKVFLDYGWEQQGVIVEEFVCYRALDPEGARTEALYRLVTQPFPAAARRATVPAAATRLPWDGAETRGICS